jgi:hypothetical protein
MEEKSYATSVKVTETVEHLFLCPVLREEQNSLRQNVDEVFKKWSIPYSSIGHLPGISIKSHWTKMLQNKLSKESETFHTFRRKDETARRGLLDSQQEQQAQGLSPVLEER